MLDKSSMWPGYRSVRRSLLCVVLLTAILVGCRTFQPVKVQSSNIRLDSALNIKADTSVENYIKPYRLKLDAAMNQVLCHSSRALFGARPESPLTNFCADLLLVESDSLFAKKFPGDHLSASVVNRGGLRVPIPKGEVSVRNMFELMPFENEVVFLQLDGEQMIQFFNLIAARGGEGVSGIRMGIKNERAVNPLIGGSAPDLSKKYWIVTSDYLANGGDGFQVFTHAQKRIAPAIKIRDMFIDHLRKMGIQGKMIDAKEDGRIYNAN